MVSCIWNYNSEFFSLLYRCTFTKLKFIYSFSKPFNSFKTITSIFVTSIVTLHSSNKSFFRVSCLNHNLFTSRVLSSIYHERFFTIYIKTIRIFFFKNCPTCWICFSPTSHNVKVYFCSSSCLECFFKFSFIYNIINWSEIKTTFIYFSIKFIKTNYTNSIFLKVRLSKYNIGNLIISRIIDVFSRNSNFTHILNFSSVCI